MLAVGAVANHFGAFEPCSTSIERKKSKESVTRKGKSGTRDFLFGVVVVTVHVTAPNKCFLPLSLLH